MFDVDWSDPTRESVGDYRARKKKQLIKGKENGHDDHDEDEDDDDEDDEQAGNRTSGSVRSSLSSAEKQFGFFSGKHRKKGGGSSSRMVKTKSVASSSLRAPTIEEMPQNKAKSASSANCQHPSTAGAHQSLNLPPKRFSYYAESVSNDVDDTERAPGGSLFGCDITNPQPGFTTLFQELGDGVSMVTKTTTVSSRERTHKDSDFLVSKIHISAGDSGSNQPSSLGESSFTRTRFDEVIRMPAATVEIPQQPGVNEPQQLLSTIQESSSGKAAEDDLATSKFKRPARPMLSAPAIAPAVQRLTISASAWKAPADWAVSPTESAISSAGTEDINGSEPTAPPASSHLDLTHMEREIENMRGASPQGILQRLKACGGRYDPVVVTETSTSGSRTEATRAKAAAAAYRDWKMEQQRWLLFALYNMESVWGTREDASKPATKPAAKKILALFENQGTTSYLAATNNNVPVYHLSPEPLRHKDYPNIHPMHHPLVSTLALAFAPDTFASVSCMSLISILPSSQVPGMLHSIKRVLAPGGLLHTILMDPCPSAASTGPLLRDWLDRHLLFNLELQFRGIHPSRSVPVWLEEANLRAKGSVITHTRFLAIPPTGRDDDSDASARTADSAAAASHHERVIKKELRATAGRLLWQEIWGPFLAGDKWWWEVPEIVNECVEKETYWEYSIVAACNASG